MAQTEDLRIDSLKFVRDRASLQGAVPMAALQRLSESLTQTVGALDYELAHAQDRQGRALLQLKVRGNVMLACQRCLEPMAWAIDINSALRPVAPEKLEAEYEADGDDPDEPDCIAHDKALDVAALIEDEVLLALPAYPRHAKERCAASAVETASSGAKVLAFNALQALKQKN